MICFERQNQTFKRCAAFVFLGSKQTFAANRSKVRSGPEATYCKGLTGTSFCLQMPIRSTDLAAIFLCEDSVGYSTVKARDEPARDDPPTNTSIVVASCTQSRVAALQ